MRINVPPTSVVLEDAVAVIDGYHDVPAADAVTNGEMRDVIGNKTDSARNSVGATYSIMGNVKGLINLHPVPGADATTNYHVRDVAGNKTDTAQTTVGTTRSLMGYLKGVLNQIASLTSRLEVQDAQTDTKTGDTNYTAKLTISGPWRLYDLKAVSDSAGDQVYVRITMDGGTPVYLRMTADTYKYMPNIYGALDNQAEPGADNMVAASVARAFAAEGRTSLLIELKTGGAGATATMVTYFAQ